MGVHWHRSRFVRTLYLDGVVMWQSVRDAILPMMEPWEGKRIPWMYLDVKCLVTTGTGNLIDPSSAALDLPWMRPDGTPADKSEVLAEWLYVKGRRDMATYGGGAFARVTHLRLTEAGLDALIEGKLDSNEAYLKKRFPAWDTFPADAQLAIMSWAWAVGPAANWPKFVAAVLERDWDTAGEESHIDETGNPGVRPRNAANVILFHNASMIDAVGADPQWLAYPEVLPTPTELE